MEVSGPAMNLTHKLESLHVTRDLDNLTIFMLPGA